MGNIKISYLPAHTLLLALAIPTTSELWGTVFSNSGFQSFRNLHIQRAQSLQRRKPRRRPGTTGHPLQKGDSVSSAFLT